MRSRLESRWGWERTEKRQADLVKRPPSGCEHCGVGRLGHCQQWSEAAGWHGFTPPTKATIRERMRARYADRLEKADA